MLEMEMIFNVVFFFCVKMLVINDRFFNGNKLSGKLEKKRREEYKLHNFPFRF